MARSVKKTPICGITTARSDRPGKKMAHGKRRAHTRNAINSQNWERASELDNPNATSDPWDFPKDGKTYYADAPAKYLRK